MTFYISNQCRGNTIRAAGVTRAHAPKSLHNFVISDCYRRYFNVRADFMQGG